jgi:copper chaperone
MSVERPIVTELGVVGMTCDHCAAAVSREVGLIGAVSVVAVDVPAGRVRVTSSAPLEPADLRAAIEEAGYTLSEA